MDEDTKALAAQLHRANEVLRLTAEWLQDAAFGPPLARVRREVLGYFGQEAPEPWVVRMTPDEVAAAEVG